MNKPKIFFKLLLSLFALLVFFPIVGGEEASAEITRNEAVRWAREQESRRADWCDVDGNGLWCTDLATAYMNYLWLKTNNEDVDPWGLYPYTTKMAYGYDNYVADNINWTVISRTASTVPEPGDIFVSETDTAGYGYGHVGIVLTPYGSSSAEIIEMSGGVKPTINTVDWGSSRSYYAEHFIRFNYFASSTAELDVNGWTDNAENGWVSGFGTFDVWINGSRVANDVNDFCQQVTLGAPYEIKDIKVADGKSFDGFSSYTRGGVVSGGRTGTINANTDVRLQFHTVDAAAFKRNHSPSNTAVYNGHSYYFYNVPTTWYEANLVSEYLGGHLVAITSASEESFVKGIIGNSDLWIGASDKNTEGNWRWTTGESMSYSDWGENQPDNAASPGEGTENYVHIWGNTGKWNDNAGCVQYPFMCEIDRAYTVRYYANGGTGAPSAQTKAVGQSIVLSKTAPGRTDYTFLGWATSASATTPQYQPGDSYDTDANLTLYAVWKRNGNTITYNANGGENPPVEQFKPAGETVTLSAVIPTRTGYTFLGWATSATATTARYQPGDRYSTDADLTLYALWRITNPPTLTGKNITMLAGDTRELADFVELTHDGVLSYTLTATAGGVVALDGQRVTATAPGSGALIVSVTEYPAAICTVNVRVVDLGNMLCLPEALNEIEEEAFAGSGITAVTVPNGCRTIGSRAFADNPGLVYVFLPASVAQISPDAFDNSPNITLYCYSGSMAASFAQSCGIRFIPITDGWVLADNVPMGAEITDRKWTYTTREYKESSSASYPGWTKYKTQKTWSAWSEWQNSEISASSDREVRTQTIVTGYNMISYCVSGPNGRSYQPSPTYTVRLQHGPYWWSKAEFDSARVFPAGSYFDYASNVAGYVLDGTAYCKWDGSDTGGYIPMFIQETIYGTQWSYRDASYTYFYYRDVNRESATDPSGQGNVSNVQEWVKYSY